MSMDDSMFDNCQIPSSQEPDAPAGLYVQSSTAEANGGTPSEDQSETPPEEPEETPEERLLDCVVVGVEEKTVDLGMDTDLGFSETDMVQKTIGESGSGVAHAGKDKILDSEWEKFEKTMGETGLMEEVAFVRRIMASGFFHFHVEEKAVMNMAVLSYCVKTVPPTPTQVDPIYHNLSLLEIAKLRGITFPRPHYWGQDEE